MVSLTVADSVDQNEWHLPTYDPRNESKYHYKLHSLDLYFWTQQDALQFINGVRRVLPQSQVEVLDEPAPPQVAGMSSVVQKLENAAISDPQYSNAASSSRNSIAGSHTATPPVAGAALPPPPPLPAPTNFVPMAYNPAAPAAPETIRHREKTPPPDEDPLNPLAVAVAYDYHKQPFTPGLPPPSQFPPSITSPGHPPPHFGAPPLHPGIQRAATISHTGLASPGLSSPFGSSFPASPGFAPPPAPASHPQAFSTPPVTNQGIAAPPPGGYPGHLYGQQQQPQGSQEFLVQQQQQQHQVYRPEGQPSTPAYQTKPETKGKLEENAARLERGVSGMFKKFEKKFG